LPTVLSVGGTRLSVGSDGSYQGETAWSDSGGGFSQFYAEPSYQYGVQGTGLRAVPDVAFNASQDSPVMIYNTAPNANGAYGLAAAGDGTSAGAPQWAGLIALANQGRALVNLPPLDGFSQTLPTIYQDSADFNDITTGNNGYSGTWGYDAGAGWDPVTGLGTPHGVQLVGDLAFHAVTYSVDTSALQSSTGSNGGMLFAWTPKSTSVASLAPGDAAKPVIRGPLTPVHRVVVSEHGRHDAKIAMPLEALASVPVGRRHHALFDEALESVLSERSFLSAI
jgi:hypothetical protein